MGIQSDQNRNPKRSEIRILRFWGDLGGSDIQMVLGKDKSGTKIWYKFENWGPKVVHTLFWDWPRRVCGAGWGFGVCQFSSFGLARFVTREALILLDLVFFSSEGWRCFVVSSSIVRQFLPKSGGGKGYPKINNNMKKQLLFLMWGDFLKIRRAFTKVLWKQVINILYKYTTKKSRTKQNIANIHRESDL